MHFCPSEDNINFYISLYTVMATRKLVLEVTAEQEVKKALYAGEQIRRVYCNN